FTFTIIVSLSKSIRLHRSARISLTRHPVQMETITIVRYGSGKKEIRIRHCSTVSTIGFLDRLLTPLIVTRSIGLRSKDAGWLAAATAAKQAHRFGTDSVDYVRSQLLALSTFLASRQNPDMKLGKTPIIGGFELFVRDGTLSSDERLN